MRRHKNVLGTSETATILQKGKVWGKAQLESEAEELYRLNPRETGTWAKPPEAE